MSKEAITKGVLQYHEKEDMYSVLYGENGYAVLLDHPLQTKIRFNEKEDWQNVSDVLLSERIGKTVEIRCLYGNYGNEKYEFTPEQAYQLVAVTDKNGRDKAHSHDFYEGLLNCVAVNFHYDDMPSHEEYCRLRMRFVRNEKGQPVYRSLHTSTVWHVEEMGNGIRIHTSYSIYTFEKADVKEVPKLEEANLIELYMSLEDDNYFGAGFYYDGDKNVHELREHVHLGMFQDSVLIHIVKDNAIRDCACRYFPMGNYVEFYDTLYVQQKYDTPMLIHNTGKMDLQIRFQMYEHVWTIKPGESKRIIPGKSDGADPEEEEEINNE